jgi:hypothetical protein
MVGSGKDLLQNPVGGKLVHRFDEVRVTSDHHRLVPANMILSPSPAEANVPKSARAAGRDPKWPARSCRNRFEGSVLVWEVLRLEKAGSELEKLQGHQDRKITLGSPGSESPVPPGQKEHRKASCRGAGRGKPGGSPAREGWRGLQSACIAGSWSDCQTPPGSNQLNRLSLLTPASLQLKSRNYGSEGLAKKGRPQFFPHTRTRIPDPAIGGGGG